MKSPRTTKGEILAAAIFVLDASRELGRGTVTHNFLDYYVHRLQTLCAIYHKQQGRGR